MGPMNIMLLNVGEKILRKALFLKQKI